MTHKVKDYDGDINGQVKQSIKAKDSPETRSRVDDSCGGLVGLQQDLSTQGKTHPHTFALWNW